MATLSLLSVLLASPPSQANAQVTCGAFIAIGISPPGIVDVGGTKTITLDVGAGAIQGGLQVTINRLKYDLDCDADFALGLPCTDQGAVFAYAGDATIITTCLGVTWTSNLQGGATVPNEIVFTPSPGVVIPAGVNPFCSLSFDVELVNPGLDTDASPLQVEMVAGFSALTMDAVCDNGLSSSGSQSGQIDVPTPTPTPTKTPTNTSTPTNTPTDTPPNTPGEEEICRTKGFWGSHSCPQTAGGASVCEKDRSQNITQAVIDAAGGSILVCGETLTDTHLNHQHSAQEALCVRPQGDQVLQLASQLTAAVLNCVISGQTDLCSGSSAEAEFTACNAACVLGNTTAMVGSDTINCVDAIDCFNNGGSFDPATGFCRTGTCANGAPCNAENPCADLSACTPLPDNCHDQPLCNEDLGLCFNQPGPAGGSKQCNAANGNTCTIFSGAPPCAQ
jgi:hypothetical protein